MKNFNFIHLNTKYFKLNKLLRLWQIQNIGSHDPDDACGLGADAD